MSLTKPFHSFRKCPPGRIRVTPLGFGLFSKDVEGTKSLYLIARL